MIVRLKLMLVLLVIFSATAYSQNYYIIKYYEEAEKAPVYNILETNKEYEVGQQLTCKRVYFTYKIDESKKISLDYFIEGNEYKSVIVKFIDRVKKPFIKN